eukprot:scaffold1790_cov257-Pinguiococcus_pyrenoidosus.AAC.42
MRNIFHGFARDQAKRLRRHLQKLLAAHLHHFHVLIAELPVRRLRGLRVGVHAKEGSVRKAGEAAAHQRRIALARPPRRTARQRLHSKHCDDREWQDQSKQSAQKWRERNGMYEQTAAGILFARY